MEFIIEFYKSLDTLNLIIFWGIIIVIILLLIFSFILLNKNKKLKKIVENQNVSEEDLPIKKNDEEEQLLEENNKIEENDILKTLPDLIPEKNQNIKTINNEKEFIAEEHVINYNKQNKTDSIESLENNTQKNQPSKEIIIPSKPYQRNVLREMSLSQTSPIGITRPIKKEEQKIEQAKELHNALSETQEDIPNTKREYQEPIEEKIKKELKEINYSQNRKTEINIEQKKEEENVHKNQTRISRTYPSENKYNEVEKINQEHKNKIESKTHIEKPNNERNKFQDDYKKNEGNVISEKTTLLQADELLNSVKEPEIKSVKSSSEKYLEEVSKKLSEAEIPDEIERTDYELEQEENAIISYQELMEKKDSIQTIDEEDAVISIEELMNRNNKQKENDEIVEENSKLYNLTEEEENDEFINQLKQFRNDL